jgi:hypothetical protein
VQKVAHDKIRQQSAAAKPVREIIIQSVSGNNLLAEVYTESERLEFNFEQA